MTVVFRESAERTLLASVDVGLLSVRDRACLRLLYRAGVATGDQVASLIFPSRRTALRRLRRLWQLGLLERAPLAPDRGGIPVVYRITRRGSKRLGYHDTRTGGVGQRPPFAGHRRRRLRARPIGVRAVQLWLTEPMVDNVLPRGRASRQCRRPSARWRLGGPLPRDRRGDGALADDPRTARGLRAGPGEPRPAGTYSGSFRPRSDSAGSDGSAGGTRGPGLTIARGASSSMTSGRWDSGRRRSRSAGAGDRFRSRRSSPIRPPAGASRPWAHPHGSDCSEAAAPRKPTRRFGEARLADAGRAEPPRPHGRIRRPRAIRRAPDHGACPRGLPQALPRRGRPRSPSPRAGAAAPSSRCPQGLLHPARVPGLPPPHQAP